MKKKLFILILALVVAFLFAMPVSAETQDGWAEEDGCLVYYENGEKLSNCVKEIDGAYYAFDDFGSKITEEGLNEIHTEIDNEYKSLFVYVTADEGKLLTNEWMEINFEYEEELYWYYFGADAIAYSNAAYEINGSYYYFNYYGGLCTGFIYDEYDNIYYADPNNDSRLKVNTWFQTELYDGGDLCWFYATADGTLYKNGVHQVGDHYYFFGYSGEMYTGFIYDDYGNTYYADPNNDSRLKVNTWFQTELYDGGDLCWFYATADGTLYCDTVQNIGGTLYAFYSLGEMVDNNVYEQAYWNEFNEYVVTAYYRAKAGGALYVNEWYEYPYDGWYYYMADGTLATGLVNIGGVDYFFEDSEDTYNYGKMLEDTYTYYHEDDKVRFLVADKNGAITDVKDNNWAQVGGKWYFVQDGTFCSYGIYDISGKKYGFNYEGQMYENCCFRVPTYDEVSDSYYEECYFAKADGTLAENEWCCEESGYGTTWWYYAGNNGRLLTSGLYNIDGKDYYFGMYGSIIDDTIYYDGENQLYVSKVNPDGSGGYVVYTEGWYTCEGAWIYVNSDGQVYEGWLNDQYYLDPEMFFGSYILMPEYVSEDFYIELYFFNKGGRAEKITADGFYSASPYGHSSYTVYVKDGKVVYDDWAYIDGEWYYFDSLCKMMVNQSHTINGIPYFFDSNGIMADDGWVRSYDGTWYYAFPDGSLFTGIDAANYVFDETGALIVDSFYTTPDGETYFTDENGIIIHAFIDGWNEINGNRYYVEDGEILRDCIKTINDENYAFDLFGRMIVNANANGYLFGADGKQVVNDWLQIDGKWYYSDEHGIYSSGIYTIGEKQYYFNSQVLQQNVTTFSWSNDAIITTDSEGVVLSITPAEGWVYSVSEPDFASGTVYYYRNGVPITDWVGPYFIQDGYMVTDSVIEWKDALYYLDKKGAYVSGGWYEIKGNRWIYARADGSLYCNEWLQYNGEWYYFYGSTMASNEIHYIDGKYHSFDANGVWLGEIDISHYENLPDGWFYFQNSWYYINATVPVYGCELYIDGAWYAFDSDGTMVENRVHGDYYYLDGGKRAEYTGWVKMKTGWSYFNQDHSVAYGWLKDGNEYYFLDYIYRYDEEADKHYIIYAAVENDFRAIDGKLYYFNASCALQYEATENGWYQANGEWYCIQNGKACYGDLYKIGNAYYAFDLTGRMIYNDTYRGRYFDKSGAMVTTSGWYYVENDYMSGWIYVLDDGRVASNGTFLIDGKEYCFYNDLWVE